MCKDVAYERESVYRSTMTLRPLIVGLALLTSPAALAATPASQPGSDTASAGTAAAPRTPQVTRKVDRTRPSLLKPRVIEAPGAAVMMIPASFDPLQDGPFSRF